MRTSSKLFSRHSHHAAIIAENDNRTRNARISGEIGMGCFDSHRRLRSLAALVRERRDQSFGSAKSRNAAALSRSDGKVGDGYNQIEAPYAKCTPGYGKIRCRSFQPL